MFYSFWNILIFSSFVSFFMNWWTAKLRGDVLWHQPECYVVVKDSHLIRSFRGCVSCCCQLYFRCDEWTREVYFSVGAYLSICHLSFFYLAIYILSSIAYFLSWETNLRYGHQNWTDSLSQMYKVYCLTILWLLVFFFLSLLDWQLEKDFRT